MNKRVAEIMELFFHSILRRGELPQVRTSFSDTGRLVSYGLFEYSENWGKFGKIVNDKLVEETGETIFTRKYNKALLDKIEEIASQVTGEQICKQRERFQTMID